MKYINTLVSKIKKEFADFRHLHKNTIIRYASMVTLFLITSSLVLLLLSWDRLPTEIPLWYSRPWGQDRLAHPSWLFLLPGASFLWYGMDSFLSLHVTKNHLVFSQILFLSAVSVSIFSCVTLMMIIWIIS